MLHNIPGVSYDIRVGDWVGEWGMPWGYVELGTKSEIKKT